jgi:hypothetical protein
MGEEPGSMTPRIRSDAELPVERVQDVAKDTVTQATQAVESVSQAVDGMAQGKRQAPA